MEGYKNFFKAAREARGVPVPDRRTRKKGGAKKLKRGVAIPVGLVFTAALGLCGAIWALTNVDQLERIIDTTDIRFLGSAFAEATAKKDTPPSSKTEKAASDVGQTTNVPVAPAKNWTPEQIAVFNKLEDRKAGLDQKEQELGKLEAELQKQRVELEDRLKDLEKLRTKIAERLTERVGADQNRVDKLVDIYSNMKPQTAAKVFEEIDEDLAVEILGKMKKKNMAEILNLLKADKAQRLSEKFAGYKAN
ncbi:MAG: hypothetical protein ABL958_12710 [Bdellovibrionia bacterium]